MKKMTLMSMALLLGITANASDDLHKWRLTENSVKISFRDTDTNEKGFRVVDADTNARLSIDVSPLEGVGKSGIVKLVGLSKGTDYSIKVETFFDDKESTFSEPFRFKTKGESSNNDDDTNLDKVATDLQSWNVKETSVKISFKDHDDEEEFFQIFARDVSTNKTYFSRHIPALADVGKFGIGKVSGLTPGTTYQFNVYNIRDYNELGDDMLNDYGMSKPIMVTTKGETPDIPTVIDTSVSLTSNIDASALIRFRADTRAINRYKYFIIRNAQTNEILDVAKEEERTAYLGYYVYGLEDDTQYTFKVEGVLASDNSVHTIGEPLTIKTEQMKHMNKQEATKLARWRLTDHSVKISFLDGSNMESGFTIRASGLKETLPKTIVYPAIEGKGRKSGIIKINGLKPNTEYSVVVVTFNGEHEDRSSIFRFKTKPSN